jgi:hypothetical protein
MRPSALLACLLLCAGCGDDSPTAPSAPPPTGARSGAWVGTLADPVNGTGTLRLDLEERVGDGASLLGGTWAMAFADAQRNARGSLSGLVTGTQMTVLGSTEPPPACPPVPFATPGLLSVSATFTSTELTGSYRFSTCTESTTGTIALRRQ